MPVHTRYQHVKVLTATSNAAQSQSNGYCRLNAIIEPQSNHNLALTSCIRLTQVSDVAQHK